MGPVNSPWEEAVGNKAVIMTVLKNLLLNLHTVLLTTDSFSVNLQKKEK